MKKTNKTWKDNAGWNIEIYENDTLIDWRHGLTKIGFKTYEKRFEKFESFFDLSHSTSTNS